MWPYELLCGLMLCYAMLGRPRRRARRRRAPKHRTAVAATMPWGRRGCAARHSALLCAVPGSLEVLQLLVNARAAVDATCGDGATPLHAAARPNLERPRCAMLCYAMLCYAQAPLCYAMLCSSAAVLRGFASRAECRCRYLAAQLGKVGALHSTPYHSIACSTPAAAVCYAMLWARWTSLQQLLPSVPTQRCAPTAGARRCCRRTA